MTFSPILKYVVVSAAGEINEMPPKGAFAGIDVAAGRPVDEESFAVVFDGGSVDAAAEFEALAVGFAESDAVEPDAAAVDSAALWDASAVVAAAESEGFACDDFAACELAVDILRS